MLYVGCWLLIVGMGRLLFLRRLMARINGGQRQAFQCDYGGSNGAHLFLHSAGIKPATAGIQYTEIINFAGLVKGPRGLYGTGRHACPVGFLEDGVPSHCPGTENYGPVEVPSCPVLTGQSAPSSTVQPVPL